MKFALALLTLVAAAPFARAADDLAPGKPAPALSVKNWIKGEPVTSLEKNKTYVVEFWATWCGPCIQSIPHLTEIAHKNKDVTFVGVSIWEEADIPKITKFVDDMGAKMDYHVGYSGNQDGMAVSWMKAAGQNGIPTAFVIKDGTVQWVGHPMELEKPLEEIKAGTFDSAKFKVAFEERAAKARRQMAIQKELSAAVKQFDAGQRTEAHASLENVLTKYADAKGDVDAIKFNWLAKEDYSAWETKATADSKSGDKAAIQRLLSFSLNQAANPKGDPKLAKKSLDLALNASDKPDLMTLQYAAYISEKLKDIPAALKYTDMVLAQIPADNAEFRKNTEKKKAELEAMSKQK